MASKSYGLVGCHHWSSGGLSDLWDSGCRHCLWSSGICVVSGKGGASARVVDWRMVMRRGRPAVWKAGQSLWKCWWCVGVAYKEFCVPVSNHLW